MMLLHMESVVVPFAPTASRAPGTAGATIETHPTCDKRGVGRLHRVYAANEHEVHDGREAGHAGDHPSAEKVTAGVSG